MSQCFEHRAARVPVGFFLLIGLIALAAAGKAILYDTLDPDCFWHLRVAEQLQREGIGPLVDQLSYASSKTAWTPYSWLAELGMKAIWDCGGYRAAVAAQALMQAGMVVFLSLACVEIQEEGSRSYVAAAVATAAGMFLSLAYLSFRPVTAAFVILAACAWLILRDRRLNERSRAVWVIIPLTVLLTNVHLFAFFVPLAISVLTIGALIERDPEKSKSAGRYAVMLVATVVAFLCTPMLPGMIRTALFYGAKDQMVSGPVITEMQSFARGPLGMASAVVVGVILICAMRNRARLRLAEMTCLLGGFLLLLKLGRFAPVFALVGCPVLATTFPEMKDRLLGKPAVCGALLIVLVAGIYRVASAFPSQDQSLASWLNRHGPDAPGYPCAAADYVRNSIPRGTGKIINEFSWGGYLAWSLEGHDQILLDGRTQVYPVQLWRDTYLGSAADRERFLSTISADAAILPLEKSRFASTLTELGWTCVFRDERSQVLTPGRGMARIEP